MKTEKVMSPDERLIQRANEALPLTEESYPIKKAAELLGISPASLHKHLSDPESDYEDIRDYRGRRYVAADDIKTIWIIRHSFYRRKKTRTQEKQEDSKEQDSGLIIRYDKPLLAS